MDYRDTKIWIGPAGKPLGFKGTFDKALEKIKELGLNACEVQFTRNIWMSEDKAKEIRKIANDLGIRLSVHAPYFINLASEKEETIKKSIERIVKCCVLAHYMGADRVVFHPGYYGKFTQEEAYKKVRDAIAEIINKLDRLGIKDVILAPEVMGSIKEFGSVEELINLAHEFEGRLIPTFDLAHYFARTLGKAKLPDDYIKVIKLFKKEFGDDLHFHTHWTGVAVNEKYGEERHLTFSEQKWIFDAMAEAFKREPVKSITIICESPYLDRDALKIKELLKEKGFRIDF